MVVNNGYVIAGQKGNKAVVLSTNLNGVVYNDWVKDFSTGQFNSIIVDDTDGNYVMAGYSELSGMKTNGYLVKISSNSGSTVWEKYFALPYYPSTYEVNFTCITNTSDGHYLVGGYEHLGTCEPSASIYKISSDDCPYLPCPPIWRIPDSSGCALGGSRFNAVTTSSKGNYIFAGYVGNIISLEVKPIMKELEDNTSSGSGLWTTVIQAGAGILNDIALTNEDCGFITVGESSNNFVIIKTDSEGNAQ